MDVEELMRRNKKSREGGTKYGPSIQADRKADKNRVSGGTSAPSPSKNPPKGFGDLDQNMSKEQAQVPERPRCVGKETAAAAVDGVGLGGRTVCGGVGSAADSVEHGDAAAIARDT
uniref:Uncharacterized protein n=1 Tax=Oryza meridionalis TaxID=40149 RepID=A0A0E0DQ38_9ORYZ